MAKPLKPNLRKRIALANLAYGWGKLATKASYHRRIDLQSQTKVHQQNL